MKQEIYLKDWHKIPFNGNQEYEKFVKTQITDKETLENSFNGYKLIFENGKLIKIFDYEDGEYTEKELSENEIGLKLPKYGLNKFYKIVEDELGFHQLGGEVPEGFQIPENDCIVPFQYLGYFDNKDKNFDWIKFRLHLICPIFLNIGMVYIDYTNPNKPVIINRKEVEKADTAYDDDLNKSSEIVFNSIKFSVTEAKTDTSSIGYCGIPEWIQHPQIPLCPKSNKIMKFVCQLEGGVTANRTNVNPKRESWRDFYEVLNFWCGGKLFVFLEPDTKVACYFMQCT